MKKEFLFCILKTCCICLLCAAIMLGCIGCKKTVRSEEYLSVDSATEVNNSNSTKVESTQSKENTASEKDNNSTTGSAANNKIQTEGKTFTICSPVLPTSVNSDSPLFEKVLYDRIEEVEKKYSCKIKIVNSIPVEMSNLVPLLQAGKDFANIIELDVRKMVPLMTAGYLIPWNDMPNIDVKDSKWIEGYTKLSQYYGKNYGLQFEKPPELRMCMIMNKTLLKSSGVDADGIYQLIEKKKWDFATFRQYAISATKVVNGVTTSYGFGGNPFYISNSLICSNDGRLVTLNGNTATATYTSQKVVEALNFFNQLVNDDKVFMNTAGMSSKSTYNTSVPDYIKQFIDGKIAFLLEDSWALNQQIKPRVKNFEYGMISVPMGPSASEYVSCSTHARMFVVPVTNKDKEFTSLIFNELAKSPEGYEDEWYWDDIQADYFQSNDKKSIEVYKRDLNNMVSDLGYSVSALNDNYLNTAVLGSIFWNSGQTPEAALKGLEGAYDSTIASMFNK